MVFFSESTQQRGSSYRQNRNHRIMTTWISFVALMAVAMVMIGSSGSRSGSGSSITMVATAFAPTTTTTTTTTTTSISRRLATFSPSTTSPFSVNTLDGISLKYRHTHSQQQQQQPPSLRMSVDGNDDDDNESDDDSEGDSDSEGEGRSESVVVDEIITSDGAVVKTTDIDVPSWKRTLLFWKYKNIDDDGLTFSQKLRKAGLSVVLSYGFVSNMSYCVSVSAAWYIFCKRTKLSPLAQGQWPSFLAVYSGFWVFNNVVRPIRFGASVALATQFDKVIAYIQTKFKVSKGAAIGLVVFLANIVGTTTLMCAGIAFASSLAGVPIRP
mmetsp:Transcript_56274/g.136417  ORF Transcript_56274/g.136417 Transcript_56274/m.136417 type:complete len:326 (+) Transcript_56274:73-1050(+)